MTLHPLFAKAVRSRALRQRPLSLVVLVYLLDDGFDDTPRLLKVESIVRALGLPDKSNARAALGWLVQHRFLILHERTSRGIGSYSLGNGGRRAPLRDASVVPTERRVA